MNSKQQSQKTTAEVIVDSIIKDLEESTFMGSMFFALSPAQKDRMKRRWVNIIDGCAHVNDPDWAAGY